MCAERFDSRKKNTICLPLRLQLNPWIREWCLLPINSKALRSTRTHYTYSVKICNDISTQLRVYYNASVMFFFVPVFCIILDIINVTCAKGVQHDGRLPFWKTVIRLYHIYVFIFCFLACGEMNSLIFCISMTGDGLQCQTWGLGPGTTMLTWSSSTDFGEDLFAR